MSGIPGDENPNPQWKVPQEPSHWQSQWQPRDPLPEPETDAAEQPRWESSPGPNPQAGGGTPGSAIAALLLGIIAVLPFCPWIFAIPALICGYSAKRKIDASGGGLGGRGLAMAGIILGWVALAFWTLIFVLVAAL